MKFTIGKWSFVVILLAGLLYIGSSYTYRYAGDNGNAWRTAINSDGVGYYAYLTGLFIEGDLAKADAAEQHFTPAGNNRVIQYYCGTPLLIAPFFLAAKAWTAITGYTDPTAMSMPYQIAVGVAAFFYLVFGLFQLRKVLLRLGMSDVITAMTLSVITFGSGLLYHAVITPSMSHVYGFALIALALAEAQRAWHGGNYGLLRTSIVLGLALLVRPTHALIILALPLVAITEPRPLLVWIREHELKHWIIAGSVGLAILFIQPLAWYLQCGLWWVDPYAGEGFNWSDPHIWSVLFGARKGFFFYWPLLLLAILGLMLITVRWRGIGVLAWIGSALIIYVTSAWWSWYYGYGYGMRPLIDILPLLAVPIAVLFKSLRTPIRNGLFGLAIPLMVLQLFQTWQYQNGIIHPFNMDKEKYAMIFLRSDDQWRDRFGWSNMAPPFAPNGLNQLADTTFYTGNTSGVINEKERLSLALVVTPEILPDHRTIRVELSCGRSAVEHNASNSAQLVYSLRKNGTDRVYQTFPLNDIRLADDRPWRT
ncbi:MAG TPA: hypothetical protein PK735_02365 [Flavobacteriales bacterium]|nr:hypothetical protein [Flavobacteriales bacterium]